MFKKLKNYIIKNKKEVIIDSLFITSFLITAITSLLINVYFGLYFIAIGIFVLAIILAKTK